MARRAAAREARNRPSLAPRRLSFAAQWRWKSQPTNEVVTGVVALDIVLPAIIAVPIATALTRLAIGGGPIYGQRSFSMSSNAELAVYGGLGLLAGGAGPLFMLLLHSGEVFFNRVSSFKPARAALG